MRVSPMRALLAFVVVFLWLVASSFLVHGLWLRQAYQQLAAVFRPLDELRRHLWAAVGGEGVFAALFVYIYWQGVEPRPVVGQGVRFAVLATLFAVVPAALAEYATVEIPFSLAARWMLAGLAQLVVAGLLTASLLGPRQPS